MKSKCGQPGAGQSSLVLVGLWEGAASGVAPGEGAREAPEAPHRLERGGGTSNSPLVMLGRSQIAVYRVVAELVAYRSTQMLLADTFFADFDLFLQAGTHSNFPRQQAQHSSRTLRCHQRMAVDLGDRQGY